MCENDNFYIVQPQLFGDFPYVTKQIQLEIEEDITRL